ncbi:MAG: type II CRISPR-associated endonuclease Cas1 [Microscillaceae bacterium]|nr:type II CRISPR-associated endonuclease Cas1 [Microscillaceae bacterium]
MIKRTLYFGTAYQLNTQNHQLVCTSRESGEIRTIAIEDIGFVVLDHFETYISPPAIEQLLAHNVAVVYCDAKHYPSGLLLPLASHTLQGERFQIQIKASKPRQKQLWQQTVVAKIENQATLLEQLGKDGQALRQLAKQVQSGDSTNREAQAARRYWASLFAELPGFARDRYGLPPNHLLNYGYAILRAATARALVGSGLLPTLGIFHRNRYNAFALADDVMEPLRPWVDRAVYEIVQSGEDYTDLPKAYKARLLAVLAEDGNWASDTSPLMVGLSQTTASLLRCLAGEQMYINYPSLCTTKD